PHEPRAAGVILDGCAYLRNEREEIRFRDEDSRPEHFLQLGFRNHSWARLDEKPEQVESFRRKVDLLRSMVQLPRVRVERPPTEDDFHVPSRTRSTNPPE